MEKITVIIPTAGINKAVINCINSILRFPPSIEIRKFVKFLIMANGVKDEEVKKYLNDIVKNDMLKFEVLWNDEPLGYIGAVNFSLKHEFNNDNSYFLLLNDDCVVYGNFIGLMYDKFKEDEKMGIVGALSLKCPVTGIDFPLGFCEMVRSCILKPNGLDERLGIGYADDTVLAINCIKNGHKNFAFVVDDGHGNRTGDFPISHVPENTMHSEIIFSRDFWDSQTAKNRRLLAEWYWPKIRIICPVYKRYVKLEKTLESIDKQTFRKLNIHVVSDGHNPKVEEIVKKFNKKYENYEEMHPIYEYSYCEHEGLCGGLPRKSILDSLESNENEWVAFIDSDNEVNSNYILKLWQNIFLQEKEYGISISRIHHEELKKDIPNNWNGEFHWGDIDSLNFLVRLDLAKKHSDKWKQREIKDISEIE